MASNNLWIKWSFPLIGMGLALVPGAFADTASGPLSKLIPVSISSGEVAMDSETLPTETPTFSNPKGKTQTPPVRMAQAIPGMETLDPHSGKIVDDNASPVEETMEATLEEAPVKEQPKIRVHSVSAAHTHVTYDQFLATGYVGAKTEPLGKIAGNLEYKSLGGMDTREGMIPYEVVFLDIGTNSGIKVGDRMIVYTQKTEMIHPLEEELQEHYYEVDLLDGEYNGDFAYYFMDEPEGREIGKIVSIKGTIEITKATPDRSQATIIYAVDYISPGQLVVPFPNNRPPMISTTYNPPRKNINGFVLGGQEKHLMNADGNIVFIDRGADHDVRPGDRFEVYIYPQSVDLEEGTIMPYVIGDLVVLSIQDKTATTMVVDATSPIVPGQRIRSKR